MVIHLARRVQTRRKLRIEERDSGEGTTSARHAASLALGMMAVDDVFESLLRVSVLCHASCTTQSRQPYLARGI